MEPTTVTNHPENENKAGIIHSINGKKVAEGR